MRISKVKDSVVLEVTVKLSSREFKILVEEDEELVKELSRLFRTEVNLVSGLTSRQKRLLVKCLRKNEMERIPLHAAGK